MKKKRQAVLLIHGIGEQRPMETLRSFVDAVWTRDASVHHPHAGHAVWSKPDNVSRNFELRRLSTPKNQADIETDFFELYWAHLLSETSYGHVAAWAYTLLARRPRDVPAALRPAYFLSLGLVALALALAALSVALGLWEDAVLPAWAPVALGVTLVPLAGFVVLRVVGDAARYLHVAPANIQCRHAIREAGVEVLRALHEPARGYQRIVVVGHSLGSVIAYDVLTHAFPLFHTKHEEGAEEMTALAELEALAGAPPGTADVQPAQRRYFDELRRNGCPWLVTDLVTLGSPLAHAALLLARDEAELRERQDARELPRCLPTLETSTRSGQSVRRFSYEQGRRGKNAYRVPHHAAVFAPTRWQNLFFPARWLLFGDVVGGPLRSTMGEHVRDVPVSTTRWLGLFSHTLYWRGDGAGAHIAALRSALDLTDERGARDGADAQAGQSARHARRVT